MKVDTIRLGRVRATFTGTGKSRSVSRSVGHRFVCVFVQKTQTACYL